MIVSFDKRSGRIISVHPGAQNAEAVRDRALSYSRYPLGRGPKTSDADLAVLSVSEDAFERGKWYKVDVSRNAVVATASHTGVNFSFGSSARSK